MSNGPETPLVMLDVVVLFPEKGDVTRTCLMNSFEQFSMMPRRV